MNISLPDPMRELVKTQVDGGQYANSSDYVRDQIRRYQQRAEKLHA
jgi:antitoxin ParD1/3/4